MTKSAMELYIYMGSKDKIKEWLDSEGVKTQQEAVDKLSPYVSSLTTSVAMSIGGDRGGSFAYAGPLVSIIESYPESNEKV